MTYEIRTLKVGVCIKGSPTYSNSMTEIEVVDEAAGEFLKISQCSDDNCGIIQVSNDEWPTLKAAIDKMIKECRDNE